MISKGTMDDYQKRSFSLYGLFHENLSKAIGLVVEDSSVDFVIHKFICLVLFSMGEAKSLAILFFCRSWPGREDNKIEMNKLVKEFHSLEEELASQNEYLEKLVSMKTKSS